MMMMMIMKMLMFTLMLILMITVFYSNYLSIFGLKVAFIQLDLYFASSLITFVHACTYRCFFSLYTEFVDSAGVEAGCLLVDEVLKTIDPQLFAHLASHFLTANVYAFPVIKTLSASAPPIDQIILLWDFYMAFGAHMNILVVAAQIYSLREVMSNHRSHNACTDCRAIMI
jgi:hypothetical protein